MQALGRHLLLELFDCDAEALNSLETVKASMVEAAKRAQATIVDVVFHEFNPFGISGVVVIAESHLAIHTWPEYRYAAVAERRNVLPWSRLEATFLLRSTLQSLTWAKKKFGTLKEARRSEWAGNR